MGRISYAGLLLSTLFLFSCQTSRFTEVDAPVRVSVSCRLVYVIHGDGSYLYHDKDGKAYRADEEALKEAISVAENNPSAEVYIFHQRRRHLIPPSGDGRFYYYRGGQALVESSYWRGESEHAFEAEGQLFRKYSSGAAPRHTFFLYYGHQVPEYDGRGYHRSYPGRSFTVQTLSEGLAHFKYQGQEKFDLVLLSTCYSGTPGVIGALCTHARYIIASPENLHLSSINSLLFRRLDDLQTTDIYSFLKGAVEDAFERLKENTQTVITVALYDTEKVTAYLDSIGERYRAILNEISSPSFRGRFRFSDCAEDLRFLSYGMSEGVDIFYRPPLFGKESEKNTHSGWECLRLR